MVDNDWTFLANADATWTLADWGVESLYGIFIMTASIIQIHSLKKKILNY